MNKTALGIQLIQTFAALKIMNRKDQLRVIKEALGQEKPIRDMTTDEIKQVLNSIRGDE